MESENKKIKIGAYFPYKVALFYVFITFMMSVVGPVKYIKYEYKYWLVGLYLAAVLLFMFVGYFFGLRAKGKAKYSSISMDKACHLVKVFLIISMISILIELIFLCIDGHISLSLSSISENYFEKEDGSSPAMILKFLMDFFRVAGVSLGIYLYKNLNKKMKTLLLVEILLIFIISLFGYGQQKTITDLFIYLFIAIFVSRLRQGKRMPRKSKKLITILLVCLFFLLSFMQSQRYSSIGVTPYNYSARSVGEVEYNMDHPFFKLFGDKLGFGMSVISTGYLSTGYYGLSLCLQLPFEWTYGIGGSRALTNIVEKVGLSSVYEKTYLSRMEKEFSRKGLASWNTIFPWLASDFSFFGVLIYFFIFGYVCALAWKEVLMYNNIVSYLVVVLCFVMILYIPANNQIFHSYGSFVSSVSILLWWLLGRRKYNLDGT